MDNLNWIWLFFENFPKWQKFFEYFIECYKDELNPSETKQKQIIGLLKTRWVERHHATICIIFYLKQQYIRLGPYFQATYI